MLRTIEVTVRFEVEGDADEPELLSCLKVDVEEALEWQAQHPDAGGLGLGDHGDVTRATVLDPRPMVPA